MEPEGNSNSGTSLAFANQLRGQRRGSLKIIRNSGPARRAEVLGEYLRMPDPGLRQAPAVSNRGQALPDYSPYLNDRGAIRGWAGEEANGNLGQGN